jgi:uncharacterized surface protein with fasciclin (FAS1) repeats
VRRIGIILTLSAVTAALVAPSVSAGAAATRQKNIVDTAVAAGQFKTLTALVQQAGLVRTLSGHTRYTVFAPTDAAFAKLPKATLDALAKDPAKLRKVLLHHVVRGRLTAAKVVKRKSLRTLNGRVTVRVRNGKVSVGGAHVVTADVGASNGVIHVIDKVLIPR